MMRSMGGGAAAGGAGMMGRGGGRGGGQSAAQLLLQKASTQLRGERVPIKPREEDELASYLNSLTQKTAHQAKSVNYEEYGDISISSGADAMTPRVGRTPSPAIGAGSKFLKKKTPAAAEATEPEKKAKSGGVYGLKAKSALLSHLADDDDDDDDDDDETAYVGARGVMSAQKPGPKFASTSAPTSARRGGFQTSSALNKASALANKITQRSSGSNPFRKSRSTLLDSDTDESLGAGARGSNLRGKSSRPASTSDNSVGHDGNKFMKKRGGEATEVKSEDVVRGSGRQSPARKAAKEKPAEKKTESRGSGQRGGGTLVHGTTNVYLTSEEESLADFIQGLSGSDESRRSAQKAKQIVPRAKRQATKSPSSSPSPHRRSRQSSPSPTPPLKMRGRSGSKHVFHRVSSQDSDTITSDVAESHDKIVIANSISLAEPLEINLMDANTLGPIVLNTPEPASYSEATRKSAKIRSSPFKKSHSPSPSLKKKKKGKSAKAGKKSKEKKSSSIFESLGIQSVEDLLGGASDKENSEESEIPTEPIFPKKRAHDQSTSQIVTEFHSRGTPQRQVSYSEDFEASISERIGEEKNKGRWARKVSASSIATQYSDEETGVDYTEDFPSETLSMAKYSETDRSSHYRYSDEETEASETIRSVEMASHRYTQDQVEKAVQLVRSKQMSLNGASKAFGIPYATLGDKVRGRRPMKAAPKTVLSCEEETKLVKWLIELSRRGFGRTKKDLKDMVKRILDERGAKTVFTDNRPGKDWMLAFFKRHTVVSERMAQPLGRERAVVTRDGLSAWFGDMKEYVDGIDPTLLSCPERIFNADESGFSICPKTKRVITMMGTKHVYSVTSGTRQQVTVLACSSAVGQYIPPLLIFPYTRDPRFNALEGFEDAFFQKTPNGWITEEVFFTFLRDIFIPSLKSKRPVVLFVDGHSSHHSMAISTLCEENGIILYCLKAHASHIIQPLDQAFFGTIKPAWNEAVRKYQYETGESITMRTFARTLKKAWDTTARPEIALKGFAKSGIFPFSPETVLSSDKLAPSCSFTSMAAASVTSSNSPSSGKPEQLSSSTTDFPTCSQPSASTSNDSSTPRSSKPERARPHVPSAAAVSNLFQLIKFNFSLGEKTVTKFMKRYEEQYNMENSTYIKWKSLMDKSLNQSPQPAASAQDIQPSTSAQDIQPSTSAQDIQPSTSAQDIQPSTSAQDIQPSTSAQDIQPSTSAQDIQPSTSAQDIQPSTSQLLPEQQSPSSNESPRGRGGMGKRGEKKVVVETHSVEIQTAAPAGLHYQWLSQTGVSVMGPSLGLGSVDPTPIAATVINPDALEALTAYSPATLAIHDMLKQQVELIKQFAQAHERLYHALSDSNVPDYKYTTLEGTKAFIRKHRKPRLTMKQALKMVEQEMGR
ncbi:hypothetical protein ACOMHN_002363 [Nucella lapillus]